MNCVIKCVAELSVSIYGGGSFRSEITEVVTRGTGRDSNDAESCSDGKVNDISLNFPSLQEAYVHKVMRLGTLGTWLLGA